MLRVRLAAALELQRFLRRGADGRSNALDQRGRLLARGDEPGYERQDERGGLDGRDSVIAAARRRAQRRVRTSGVSSSARSSTRSSLVALRPSEARTSIE